MRPAGGAGIREHDANVTQMKLGSRRACGWCVGEVLRMRVQWVVAVRVNAPFGLENGQVSTENGVVEVLAPKTGVVNIWTTAC